MRKNINLFASKIINILLSVVIISTVLPVPEGFAQKTNHQTNKNYKKLSKKQRRVLRKLKRTYPKYDSLTEKQVSKLKEVRLQGKLGLVTIDTEQGEIEEYYIYDDKGLYLDLYADSNVDLFSFLNKDIEVTGVEINGVFVLTKKPRLIVLSSTNLKALTIDNNNVPTRGTDNVLVVLLRDPDENPVYYRAVYELGDRRDEKLNSNGQVDLNTAQQSIMNIASRRRVCERLFGLNNTICQNINNNADVLSADERAACLDFQGEINSQTNLAQFARQLNCASNTPALPDLDFSTSEFFREISYSNPQVPSPTFDIRPANDNPVIGWHTIQGLCDDNMAKSLDGGNRYPLVHAITRRVLEILANNQVENLNNIDQLIILTPGDNPPTREADSSVNSCFTGGILGAAKAKTDITVDGTRYDDLGATVISLQSFFQSGSVIEHELGHVLGLKHANSWVCANRTVPNNANGNNVPVATAIGHEHECTMYSYGDPRVSMGGTIANDPDGSFVNATAYRGLRLAQLDWLPENNENISTIENNTAVNGQEITLTPIEVNDVHVANQSVKLVEIPIDEYEKRPRPGATGNSKDPANYYQKSYFVEMRNLGANDSGIFIYQGSEDPLGYTRLIDNNPAGNNPSFSLGRNHRDNPNDLSDAHLTAVVGNNSFEDPRYGIRIELECMNGVGTGVNPNCQNNEASIRVTRENSNDDVGNHYVTATDLGAINDSNLNNTTLVSGRIEHQHDIDVFEFHNSSARSSNLRISNISFDDANGNPTAVNYNQNRPALLLQVTRFNSNFVERDINLFNNSEVVELFPGLNDLSSRRFKMVTNAPYVLKVFAVNGFTGSYSFDLGYRAPANNANTGTANPTATDINPKTATLGLRTTFEFSGTNLSPNTIGFIPKCVNPVSGGVTTTTDSATGVTTSTYSLTCTPGFEPGKVSAIIKNLSGEDPLAEFELDFVEPPEATQVYNIHPYTASLGEETEFTVYGKGLPDNMAFFIEQCPDLPNNPAGPTETTICSQPGVDCSHFRTLKCTPGFGTGPKAGVVKDAPGGTELLNFAIEVVDNDFESTPPELALSIESDDYPIVYYMTPEQAELGIRQIFTFVGSHLYRDMDYSINGCDGVIYEASISDANSRSFSCIPNSDTLDISVDYGELNFFTDQIDVLSENGDSSSGAPAVNPIESVAVNTSPSEAFLGQQIELRVSTADEDADIDISLTNCSHLRDESFAVIYSCVFNSTGVQNFTVTDRTGSKAAYSSSINITQISDDARSNDINNPDNISENVYEHGSIHIASDNDYYGFTAQSSGWYQITVTGNLPNPNIVLREILADSSNRKVGETQLGENFLVRYMNAGQELLIKVGSTNNSSTGHYSIRVEEIANPLPSFLNAAETIPFVSEDFSVPWYEQNIYLGPRTINHVGERKAYKFTAAFDKAYSFSFNAGNGVDDFEFTLLDKDQNIIRTDFGGSLEYTQNLNSGDQYYILVSKHQDVAQNYSFSIEENIVLDIPSEASEAVDISVVHKNRITSNSGISETISPAGDVDWYKFTIPVSANIRVYTEDAAAFPGVHPLDHDSINLKGSIYSSDDLETPLATGDHRPISATSQNNVGSNFAIPVAYGHYVPLTAGTYYIKVEHSMTKGTSNYRLVVETSTNLNDDVISFADINLGESFTGSIEESYDNDQFKIPITKTMHYNISLYAVNFDSRAAFVPAPQNPPGLETYPVNRGYIRYSDSGETALSFRGLLLGGQEYRASVSAWGDATGDYSVSVTPLSGNSSAFITSDDHHDIASLATEITMNTSFHQAPANGDVRVPGDLDYFVIKNAARGRYTLSAYLQDAHRDKFNDFTPASNDSFKPKFIIQELDENGELVELANFVYDQFDATGSSESFLHNNENDLYIAVTNQDANYSGNFNFTVNYLHDHVDSIPDDKASIWATVLRTLTVGASNALEALFHDASDTTDAFRFTVPGAVADASHPSGIVGGSGYYSFETTGTSNTRCKLYDKSNRLFEDTVSGGEGNNCKIYHFMYGGQTAELQVLNNGTTTPAYYGVKAEFISPKTFVDAGLVANVGSNTDSFDGTGGIRRISFTPTESGEYTFTITGTNGSRLFTDIRQQSTNSLVFSANQEFHSNRTFTVVLQASQSYWLESTAASPFASESYNIDISLTPDDKASIWATVLRTLTVGASNALEALFHDTSDTTDAFRFTVPGAVADASHPSGIVGGSGYYSFETTGTSNTRCKLYDKSKRLFEDTVSGGEGNNCKIYHFMYGGQTAELQVLNNGTTTPAYYGIKAEFISPKTFVDAGLVANVGSNTDSFDGTGGIRRISFTPTESGEYTFTITGANGSRLFTDIRQQSTNSLVFSANQEFHSNRTFTVVLQANQSYWLESTAASPFESNSYGILISL